MVEDLPCPGRPSISATDDNIDEMKKIVLQIDILAHGSVHLTLVDKKLTLPQKDYRKQISMDMLDRINSCATFLVSIITDDKAWVYKFDMETSQQSSVWQRKDKPKP